VLTFTAPYNRSLGNGLVLKSVADLRDVDRFDNFDQQIFGENVGDFAKSIMLHHPSSQAENWLMVEDETSGEVVSCLCLIPWTWRYEGVTLKCGELGIVGTHQDYRHRGLVRALVTHHRELLHAGDYDLSHIQGIPYFYRQFDYEYALQLEAQWTLELHNVPDEAISQYTYLPATLDDIPVLMRLYDEAAHDLSISTVRDATIWHYLLAHAVGTETEAETSLVMDTNGGPVGYFRIMRHGFGDGLIVGETSRLGEDASDGLLRHLKTVALARNKPYIRLNLPTSSSLVRAARCYHAHDGGSYAWQIHLVDVARLLQKLAPVLERRIAASHVAGLTRTICLNIYREAFELHFERGKLLAVTSIGFSDGGDLRIPPLLLAPLLLGYRSREELSKMYPDFSAYGKMEYLVDVLFPKVESFIYTIY
jgi:predicted N-acetyltransferase YhbS